MTVVKTLTTAHLRDAAKMIRTERDRQIKEEGYTPEHDLKHNEHEALILAAATYEIPPEEREEIPHSWPYSRESWKPSSSEGIPGRIKELVKAGALYMAAKELMEARATQSGNEESESPLKQAVCEKIDLMTEMIAELLQKKEVTHEV